MERVTGLLEKMKLLASEKKGIPKGDLQKASENAHTISKGGTSGPVLRVPMKFMAWNCRGLGNALTMRGLLRCQRSVQADILFLSETRLDDRGMERIKFSLGLSNLLVVKGDGKGGGIVVLWRTWVNVSLRTYSINHIDVDVVEDDGFALVIHWYLRRAKDGAEASNMEIIEGPSRAARYVVAVCGRLQ